jgi:hypothetical protein
MKHLSAGVRIDYWEIGGKAFHSNFAAALPRKRE